MKTKMHDFAGRHPWIKPAVVIGLVSFCVALEVLIHAYLNIAVAFTHIFYLPIVIAGIWYYKKAVVIALILGAMHIDRRIFHDGICLASGCPRPDRDPRRASFCGGDRSEINVF